MQANEVDVHRDNDLNSKVNYNSDNIQTGYFGINCHRASASEFGSVNVDKWSAGCQVFANPHDFDCFLLLCKTQQRERGWETFTYTLLNGGW